MRGGFTSHSGRSRAKKRVLTLREQLPIMKSIVSGVIRQPKLGGAPEWSGRITADTIH